ncbi:hypothetical protein PUN28_008638 [Cardiocondyla obscurior]|uniref:Uncharacterized protein n=1 Tax=Cardiocondyla obscurior TaxID=286306 RepID=A0AAW2G0F6_9HYME
MRANEPSTASAVPGRVKSRSGAGNSYVAFCHTAISPSMFTTLHVAYTAPPTRRGFPLGLRTLVLAGINKLKELLLKKEHLIIFIVRKKCLFTLHRTFLFQCDGLLKLDIEIIHLRAVMRIKATSRVVELLPPLYAEIFQPK